MVILLPILEYSGVCEKAGSVREWICPKCGSRHNWDTNAAIRILRKAIGKIDCLT